MGWIKFPYLWVRYGSPVKSDETVVLFPQSASVSEVADSNDPAALSTRCWTIPVHAWIVEKEENAISRLLGRHSLLSVLGLLGVVDRRSSSSTFENRLGWFMADREINKKISVVIGGEKYLSPRSGANGHVRFTVPYRGDAPDGSTLSCELADLPDGVVAVAGKVQLVPERGVSVISDIDDTIKISNVTDKRELVRGLFFNRYHTAPGMVEFYQKLSNHGLLFHYVSASPWQLYPSLAPFMDKYFPFGCLSQRHFYVADQSFVNFFRSSMQYKIKTVAELIGRFPRRKFILIGDSGEKDPEVYAQIAQRFPEQVMAITIREVYIDKPNLIAHGERWEKLANGLAAHQHFAVFHDPAELGDYLAVLNLQGES